MPNSSITVYSNPSCVQCEQTKKYLEKNNIPFESKMIQDSPEVLELIAEKGYTSAPVVVWGETSWSGFRLDHLSGAVKGIRARG